MGLMGRSAMHPRWTKHHVDTVVDFMRATITIIRKLPNGEPPIWNQQLEIWEGGEYLTVQEDIKARVQPYGIIGDVNVAQDTTGRRLMRVQVENLSSDVQLDDVLIVTACENDPELVKYTYEIRGAIGSSNSWVRDLVCEADLKGV